MQLVRFTIPRGPFELRDTGKCWHAAALREEVDRKKFREIESETVALLFSAD